jgi:hypothetical protein
MMDDGFDRGGMVPPQNALSMLRSAATERMRQSLGTDGLAASNPMQLADMANDILESLVANRADKPTIQEQRQMLREVVDVLNAERMAAGKSDMPEEPEEDPLADPQVESESRNAPDAQNNRPHHVKAQIMPLLKQRLDISVAS